MRGQKELYELFNELKIRFEYHVHLFIDNKLAGFDRLAFHPNVNTASLVITKSDFIRFLEYTGNTYELIRLYD